MDAFGALYSSSHANFAFDNPGIDTTEQAKEVLLSADSTAQKARKLFLLERMHHKAGVNQDKDVSSLPPPPEVASPLVSEVIEKANRASIRNPDAAKRVTATHMLRKKKLGHGTPATALYDPAVTALGVDPSTAVGFYDLREILQCAEVELPLPQRLELCRDVARQLEVLLEGEGAQGHGMLLSSCFVTCEGLRVVVAEASISVEHADKSNDVLDLGLLLVEALVRGNSLEAIPELIRLVKGVRDDDVEAMSVDLPLRTLLRSKQIPGSLVELASQLCSSDVSLRPTAEDAHAWLDSILEDLARLSSGKEQWIWRDNPAWKLRRVNSVVPARPRNQPLAEDDGYSSDATASARSYASDDSFLPDSGRPRGSSRLSQFLAKEPSQLEESTQLPRRHVSADDLVTAPSRKVKLVREHPPAAAAHPGVKVKAVSAADIAQAFNAQQRLTEEDAMSIVRRAEEKLRKDPTVLQLSAPCIVIGDIHGQWFDLFSLMTRVGDVHKQTIIFLGDYVDRGQFSCECLLYLLALKVQYSANVFLLRGNHESEAVSSYFGFREEAEAKYGRTFFHRCIKCFQAMPLAARLETIAGTFLCLHGGLSPSFSTLAQLNSVDRFAEPGMNGALCDVLWSDPVNDEDPLSHADFTPNEQRGCSFRFGYHALSTFMKANGLSALIRGHEVQQAGYKVHFVNMDSLPVVTVFSAPNYCGRYGNRGAFLRIHNKSQTQHKSIKKTIRPLEIIEPVQFAETEHPPPAPVGHHHQREIESGIQLACPYLATTYYGFSSKALQVSRSRQVEVTSPSKAAPPPAAAASHGSSHLLHKPKFKSPLEHFQSAVQSDSLNEMNPRVVSGKVQEAKKRLSIIGADRADADVVVSVASAGKPSSRKTLLRNPSIVGGKAAMLKEEDVDEVLVTFSSQEMLAIQTLFLVVDRADKGFVSAQDLIAWASEMTGMDVGEAEANRVLKACDVDGDKQVTFDDFLAVVGAMKDIYLVEEYLRVKEKMKDG